MGQVLAKLKDVVVNLPNDKPATAYENGAVPVSDVLFFPDSTNICRNWAVEESCRFGRRCKYVHQVTPFTKLLRHLSSAKRSMDVCVFTITNNMIRDAIIAQHEKGIRVRIITDDSQSQSHGSDITELARRGIRVVHDNSEFHMHHKFCIIDNTKLLNGSLNWSVQGVRSNQENVMITTDPALVRPFRAAFDKMWSTFARNKAG